MKGTEASRVPAKIKIVYMQGYRAAIKEICQKLEAQAVNIQENIEQLEREHGGA